MTFLSLPFFVLFSILLAGLALCRNRKKRQVMLLAASYLFYAWADVRYLLLLLFQTTAAYGTALAIENSRAGKGREKRRLAAGITVCLLVLACFKFGGLFAAGLEKIGMLSPGSLRVIVPVGISFYTFQALSYMIGVYRKNITAERKFLKVALYVGFFPQLLSGPIMRPGDFLPQLDEEKKVSSDQIAEGLQIFLFGVLKKIVIADRLAVCVDSVYGAYQAYSGASLIWASFAYSIQIYCDFSGYSDMAVGIAKMMGYTLCRNFNLPYLASNPSEFWKRWHISLSGWFRDYVYIPLGGNRKGEPRACVNTFATMVLSGIWHGTGFNYLCWGAVHGAAGVAHRLFLYGRKRGGSEKGEKDSVLPKALRIAANFLFVNFAWTFFRAESVGDALGMLSRMITLADGVNYYFVFVPIYGLLVFCACVWAYLAHRREGFYPILNLSRFSGRVVFCIVIWLILAFYYPGDNSFIYFQF